MVSLAPSRIFLSTNEINSVDEAGRKSTGWVNATQFRLMQMFIILGLILGIVGGTSSTSSTGVYTVQATSKAAVIIYLVAFILLVLVAVFTLRKLTNAPGEEKRIAWATIGAFPFILIRIIYSLLAVFSNDPQFNLLTGSVIIHVFMSVVEEMAVVVIYLAIGWRTPALPHSSQGPLVSRPWKGDLTGGGGVREKVRGSRGRQGPIHTLVGMGIDAARRKEGGGEA
jgi:hypothetical protein